MEFVGIFLLLAPLGALILYLRRSAAMTAPPATGRPFNDQEASVASVLEEPAAEPAPEAEPVADAVEDDAPRRMQV